MEVLLAFSPHLDDAVLSVGASLRAVVEDGGTVIVCTVFAGEPTAPLSPAGQAFHRACGLGDDAVSARRAEDRDAAEVLGIESVHLPLLECLYRKAGTVWLYDRAGAAFDPEWPSESAVTLEVIGHLRSLIRKVRPTSVWTCLAVGGHVDHRICRAAVEAACMDEGMVPSLWEDVPYAFGTPMPAGSVTAVAVSERHMTVKVTAVGCYKSQLRVLWPEGSDWRSILLTHHAERRSKVRADEPLLSAQSSTDPYDAASKGDRVSPWTAKCR